MLWRIAEQGGKQLIYFIISVILARLIEPDQFGMVAMLTVFTAVANVFIDAGFSEALIRKQDRSDTDCNTIYWFNIIISTLCYIILFICAPLVAEFYEMEELKLILRVTSLGLIIGSFAGVQRTLLQAELDFKSLMKFNLLGLIISGIVGVTLAFLKFEVWALVFQNLTMVTVTTIAVYFKTKWHPKFEFSVQSIKEFFGFGSKLFASGILDSIYSNIYSIVIGKFYHASDLAFYNRAHTLGHFTSSLPTNVLQSITYPTLCKLQDNDIALKEGYRRIIKISGFVIFPLCMGMGAVAYPLIEVLYTKTWMFTASLLSILVFSLMWYPIHSINLNYLVVKGRSNLFLRLEIIKKIQGVIVLCFTIPLGIKAMCWGSVFTSLMCLIYNTHYTGKFLKMSIFAQLRDLTPALILSAVMYAGARTTAHFMGNDLLSLVCSVAVGATIYIGGAYLFRLPELKELLELKK